jgi:hypothetical protein
MQDLSLANCLTEYTLVRFTIPGDGSCLIHSICKAYLSIYDEYTDSDKKQLVRNIRKSLARQLPYFYNQLSRGGLCEFSRTNPEFALETMVNELNSTKCLDYVYLEYISNYFDKDIYIIDADTQDVRMIGCLDEKDCYYKHRKSIILLYYPKQIHYECIGYRHKGEIYTLFSPDRGIIRSINARMHANQHERIKD